MQIIPAIDILGGRVVRLYRGVFASAQTYSDRPLEVASRFLEEGAALVHVVDLAGAQEGVLDLTLWETFGSAGIPFQAGGGIRRAAQAAAVLACGASRVVLGTAALFAPEELAEFEDISHVVAALDVSQGRAYGDGWLGAGKPLGPAMNDLAAVGVRRLLVTSISQDGTLTGPDFGLLASVSGSPHGFATIASGGVGSLADLARLEGLGLEAAVVGRALYEGRFTLGEALTAVS